MFSQFIDIKLLPERSKFITSQNQQAWIRLILGIVFTAYIAFHGPYFNRILGILAVSIPAYLCLNLFSLYWIRKQPYSLPRLLLIPLIDCYLITLAMWADGGHMSVAFFLLMSPIIGNGFRYGSNMMRYCQVLGVLSMLAISLITVYHLHQPMDWLGLMAELLAILYISGYSYNILSKTESTLHAKLAAEASASRLIAENPHPAFTFDPEAVRTPILFANPAMSTLISANPESLVDRPIDSIVITEDRSAFLNTVLDRDTDKVRQCYVRLPGVLDQPVQVKCEISSIEQGGKIIGLCYMTDISESERLQYELAEAQKLAYTAALAAGIAHDFRNILSGMIGQAELIELENNNPKLKEDARHIIEAGRRGSNLIEQLLELGRSDSSEYQVMDISESLANMLQIARVQLPPDIELSVHTEPGLPLVRANAAQLEQVLLNLISNAAQAMQNNQGRIEVFLSHCESKGDEIGVSLSVKDNGIGIDPENLQHIFKPFWSTRKQNGGTGLGMAMVQRIVRWHNGMVEVSSTLGQGTTIKVSLPSASDDMGAPFADIQDNTPVPLDNPNILPWKVLLVEDQPEVLRIHKAFLTNMGHRVVTAVDGKEALELFRSHDRDNIDIIITDYMMPNMDGIELARHIRQVSRNLPIAVLTAYGEDQALSELTQNNIDVLNKPISYHAMVLYFLQKQASYKKELLKV